MPIETYDATIIGAGTPGMDQRHRLRQVGRPLNAPASLG